MTGGELPARFGERPRRDDEDRSASVLGYLVGDAAEHEGAQAAEAARA